MDKRYQVFVSSTYQDLQQERQPVMQALLELDCIPAGMELFPAADEDQWSLIKEVIDDCDYYIAIIAGRYGSVGSDGMGYTEKEYRYAVECGKPVIAFLHKDPESLPGSKLEKSPKLRKKLQEFRQLAQKKMCKFWSTPHELGLVVSSSLVKLVKRHPGIGWVRADRLPDEEANSEILRLRRTIEELDAEIAEAAIKPPPETQDLQQGNDELLITYLIYVHPGQHYEPQFATTWNDIFAYLGPSMLGEARESSLREDLNNFGKEKGTQEIRKLAGNRKFSLWIAEQDFYTIIVQLRALGLIAQSLEAHSTGDTWTYWKLTKYGDNLMTRLRAIHRQSEA